MIPKLYIQRLSETDNPEKDKIINLIINKAQSKCPIKGLSIVMDIAHPDFRKANIGSTLLYLAEQIADDIGFDVITLEVQENSWMQKWYRKKCYREYGYSSKNKNLIWMIKQMK